MVSNSVGNYIPHAQQKLIKCQLVTETSQMKNKDKPQHNEMT